jgi:hypothetical protein
LCGDREGNLALSSRAQNYHKNPCNKRVTGEPDLYENIILVALRIKGPEARNVGNVWELDKAREKIVPLNLQREHNFGDTWISACRNPSRLLTFRTAK